MPVHQNQIAIEELTDADELAQAHLQRQRFDRNVAWWQTHAVEVYTCHRGRYVCIAGEELFVADTSQEAVALAAAAHPEDNGRFVQYVPREKVARIYANHR